MSDGCDPVVSLGFDVEPMSRDRTRADRAAEQLLYDRDDE